MSVRHQPKRLFGFIRNRCTTSSEMAVRHTPKWLFVFARDTHLRPTLRGATYEALFGLLACTGMRVGEAIALDRTDIDLLTAVVEINDAKFRKHRRLPLHGSAVAALRHY